MTQKFLVPFIRLNRIQYLFLYLRIGKGCREKLAIMECGCISNRINQLFSNWKYYHLFIFGFTIFIKRIDLGGTHEKNYCRFKSAELAITQTKWVIEQLKNSGPFEFEVKEIVTKGDKIVDVTLSKVGGKGLFVKEIEQAMLDKEIDMAVHSMKDMPAVCRKVLRSAVSHSVKITAMRSFQKIMLNLKS